MTEADESREQGVEFGPLADDLADESYPMSKARLIESYGDRVIDLEDGSQTVRDIVEPLGEDAFESAGDVRDALIGMASEGAVGRKGYSDRGGHSGDEGTDESV